MKTNYNVIFALLLAFTVHFTFAQKTITGNVIDESGPLPGVSVLIKGTTTGTETDFDGNYSLQAKQGDVLQYSFIGMETAFKTVGTSNKMDVQMTVSTENVLEEVIINALGIETRQVSRTSSISKVEGAKIAESGETSIAHGLAGKAAGVAVVSSSGDPGSSAYVQIRGQTSITRDLQPLYVVDGIPLNTDEIGGRVDGVAQQSRVNDINPDDIASVKVLKGASAAALWGSRAANGVILITTKSGKGAKVGKINVSVSSKVSLDQSLTRVELQDIYGKGDGGTWNDGPSGSSWGDLISSRSGDPDLVDTEGNFAYFIAPDGTVYNKVLEKNSQESFNEKNYNAIFGTGLYLDNSVSISTRTDNGSFYASFSKLDQDGTIGGGDGLNFYDRITGRFNADIKVSEKIKLKGTASYSNTNANRIQQGSNLSGLLLGLYRTPADFDNTHYIGTHYTADGIPNFNSHRAYRAQYGTPAPIAPQTGVSPEYNNSLWTLNKQKNPSKVNRFVLGMETTYYTTDWLSIISKFAIDSYTDDRYSLFPLNSSDPDPDPSDPSTGNGNGWLDEDLISYNQYQVDLLAQIDKDITENLTSFYTVGFSALQRNRQWRGGEYKGFILDSDQIDYNNGRFQRNWYSDLQSRTAAMYATADFDYNNLLLVHLTGRAEQATTFGDDRIYFFPSAELGFNFGSFSLFDDSDFISKGKLRLAWGQVGQQPTAYATNQYYTNSAGFDSYIAAAVYDVGSYVPSSTLFDKLKPEITTEYEVGLDLSFIRNRINLSATYYENKVDDVLLFVSQPASTGYTSLYGNAAKMENTGFEVELNADIIRNDNLTWNLGGSWSKNDNLVTDMFFTENQFLDGFAGTSAVAREGYPLSILWGVVYEQDTEDLFDGEYVLGSDNFPELADDEGYLGDPNPDWLGSLNSSLSYKGFKISALMNASMGGDLWYGTYGALTHFGRTPITANQVTVSASEATDIYNYSGFNIVEIVEDDPANSQNADGTYTVRGNLEDFGGGTVLLDEAWYLNEGGGFNGSAERFMRDASWIKLRELSLSYTFNNFKESFLESVTIGATGRNLWLWTKDKDLDIDPESNLTGASNGRGLQYFNHPTTKSYLGSVKINF